MNWSLLIVLGIAVFSFVAGYCLGLASEYMDA